MQAEIISIGDELLIGMTIDSNSAWMATELTNIGIKVYQTTTVSDNKEHILKVIDEAMDRSELVLVTGGLGPTSDDITKPVLCEYFNSNMVFNEEVYGLIQALLSKRGLDMNENNRKQAEVPADCRVLLNSKGTAPGMLFEKNGHILVSMPGVPYEMKDIIKRHVIPYIMQHFKREAIVYRTVMTYGTFEARLAEILEGFEKSLPDNISLAYLPTAGIIKLRITARGKKEDELHNDIDKQILKLQGLIPEYVYGYDGEGLELATGSLLKKHRLTVAIAESCTGGSISQMLTSVAGSSEYFIGSVIAYNNNIKTQVLGVAEKDIIEKGAVSKKVVRKMAEGIRKKFNTDFGVATTGIAGPDGGSDEKPVGTVWIAVSSQSKTRLKKYTFGNTRAHNIRRSSLAALSMLRHQIIRTVQMPDTANKKK